MEEKSNEEILAATLTTSNFVVAEPASNLVGVAKPFWKSLWPFGNSDEELRETFQQGLEAGLRKGIKLVREKFAAELERNDNFRIAAFALGNHIAKLSGNQREKLDMIVYTLGHPGSNILSGYVRSENKKIIDNPPAFYEIKNKYLSKLNSEQLRLIDKFLKDVVEAGDYNSACSNFYNNDWKNYLRNNSISAEQAQELFRKARCYYFGWEGYPENEDKAFELYLKAARAGHQEAKNALKNLYNFSI